MNQDKQQFYSNMNTWLKEKQDDYNIYFVSYSFNQSNKHIKEYSNIWFHKHIERLNNELLSRGKHYRDSAILILYPETDAKYNRLHFHGILLIHKNSQKRFFDRVHNGVSCIEKAKKRERKNKPKTPMDVPKFYTMFCDKVMQPFTNFEPSYNRNCMKIIHTPRDKQDFAYLSLKSYRFYRLQTEEDINKTHQYSQKHFDTAAFNVDDIMIFKKSPKNRKDKEFALKRKASANPTKQNNKNYKYAYDKIRCKENHINQTS